MSTKAATMRWKKVSLAIISLLRQTVSDAMYSMQQRRVEGLVHNLAQLMNMALRKLSLSGRLSPKLALQFLATDHGGAIFIRISRSLSPKG